MPDRYTLHHGDCLELMRAMPDNSIDAILTDPPYGLSQHRPDDIHRALTCWLNGEAYHHGKAGFMGRDWDAFPPGPEYWREALRVLKPGGHMLAFAGTRSMDLMSMAIRLAGFELRDSIGYAHDTGGAPLLAWCFGSGLPKSLDISKALDKKAGMEREVVMREHKKAFGYADRPWKHAEDANINVITAPASDEAKQWQGFGTALKPAWEPIILARKPLEGTAADNVLAWGCGGLNIDGCRVGVRNRNESGWSSSGSKASTNRAMSGGNTARKPKDEVGVGRFPANVIHDGSEEVVALFPETGPSRVSIRDPNGTMGYHGGASGLPDVVSGHNDNGGSAARFFYCAKASKRDRDEGLELHPFREKYQAQPGAWGVHGCFSGKDGDEAWKAKNPNLPRKNNHPTVKPTALLTYLCRLITPPGGTVLDPFAGSGSTGKAALLEGFHFIGVEREAEYIAIAEARLRHAQGEQRQPDLFDLAGVTA